MTRYIVGYVATLVVLAVVDAGWLMTAVPRLYKPLLGSMLLERPVFPAAIVFYLVYALGIVVFALAPSLASGRWTTALMLGALLGLVAYATYDLTNLATLKGWPVTLAVVDLVWGSFLTAIAAAGSYFIVRALG